MKNILKTLNTILFSFISLTGAISLINLVISNTFYQIIKDVPAWTICIGAVLSWLCGEFMIKTCIADSKRNSELNKNFEDLKNQYEGDK